MSTGLSAVHDPQDLGASLTKIVGQFVDPALRHPRISLLEDPDANCCWHDPLARAYQHLKAKPPFHHLHVAGQGGLRQAKRFGRPGEGAGANDFVKLKQMPRVDDCHLQYISKFDENRSKDNFSAMVDCFCREKHFAATISCWHSHAEDIHSVITQRRGRWDSAIRLSACGELAR